MDKNNLNLDNKFGECCNCPGVGNGQYLFTNNVSSRIYNDQMGKKLKATDSHDYRSILQKNAKQFITNEILRLESTKCKPSNKFYIDSSKFHPKDKLIDEYTGPMMINDGKYKSKFSDL